MLIGVLVRIQSLNNFADFVGSISNFSSNLDTDKQNLESGTDKELRRYSEYILQIPAII